MLHRAGLCEGFQRIDGSFLEDVETRERRAPHDVDVVTFYVLPEGLTQQEILEAIPNVVKSGPASTKVEFRVDGYLVDLGVPPSLLVERSTYWYGVWSHTRDLTWKGFVQVDLSPNEEKLREGGERHEPSTL